MSMLSVPTARLYRLLQRFQQPVTQYLKQRSLERYHVWAGRLLTMLAQTGQGELCGAPPVITRSLITRSDVAILLLGETQAGPATKILKLPLTPDAIRSTQQHRRVAAELHAQPALQSLCALVPRPLAWGSFEQQEYYLETMLAGTSASDLIRRSIAPVSLKADAVHAIHQLHSGTLRRQVVTDAMFAQLAGDDLVFLNQCVEHWPQAALLRSRLQILEGLLRDELVGHDLPFAWTHGDYWPGNILVKPSGGVSGIVDWDRATPCHLPLLDVLHLLAYTSKMRRRTDLGAEIIGYLLPAAFDPEERMLIDETLALFDMPTSRTFLQAVTLLYWLRFAAANLRRYPKFKDDARWLNQNVFAVLKQGVS